MRIDALLKANTLLLKHVELPTKKIKINKQTSKYKLLHTYYLKQSGLPEDNIKVTDKHNLYINLLRPLETCFVTVTE